MLYNLLLGIILGFIFFTMYVANFVKGVIFRMNDQGNLVFTPHNLLNLSIYPIYNIDFWSPKMWTLNFFLYIVISTFIVCLVRRPI